jgi:hypothetical protein
MPVSPDSLLYASQLMVLHMLGIDEAHGQNRSPLFEQSPLEGLPPWQYFVLLDRFGAVVPYLRPEKTLAALARKYPLCSDACPSSLQDDTKKGAIHLSLFHALFVCWPEVAQVALTPPMLQKKDLFAETALNQHTRQEMLYPMFLDIFSRIQAGGGQEVLLRQEQPSAQRHLK